MDACYIIFPVMIFLLSFTCINDTSHWQQNERGKGLYATWKYEICGEYVGRGPVEVPIGVCGGYGDRMGLRGHPKKMGNIIKCWEIGSWRTLKGKI